MTPTPLLLLLSVGAVLTIGASATGALHAAQTLSGPSAPQPDPASATKTTQAPLTPGASSRGKRDEPGGLRFEEYLGKDQAWFAKRFGVPEGSTGVGGGKVGGPEPLAWKVYDRRRELGGGKGQMASASYPIGGSDAPFAKVLSVGFDGPVGREPVATHVDHGIDPKPSRTLEQEARYVGVNLADYQPIGAAPSGMPGSLRFVHRKHPEVMLEANDLNDTWQISLRLDPLQGR